jgi:hypothetical protein
VKIGETITLGGELFVRKHLTKPTYHFAAEFVEVGE